MATEPRTKHQPATPLPWRARVDARCWWRLGPARIITQAHGKPADRQADALYITHACNAYPGLVAALRGVELLARVNAPIYDESPAHKSIRALLAKLGEGA